MARITAAGLWHETSAVVARHVQAFGTLAAATVFLPSAALRLLSPAVASPAFDPSRPPLIPPGFWALLIAVLALQFIGVFAIAAITADRSEGGGKTLGQIIADALPGLGRFVLALLLFFVGYLVASLVLVIVFAILAAISTMVSPGMMAGAGKGQPPMALVGLIIVTIVPLIIWLWARLSPLVGVYLREPLGVVAGIRRAWLLSRGSTAPIAALILVFVGASLAVSAVQVGIGNVVGETGIVDIVVNLIVAAVGALFFVYAAAGTGIVYRELAAGTDVFA